MAKKTNVYAENDIKTMDLDSEVLKILLDNDVKTVGALWEMNRKKLKAIGVKDSDIKQIIIKLQLLGLDLNKRIYS